MPKTMTRSQYNALPPGYRGKVDGQPFALYLDENGATVYGPVEITDAIPSPTDHPGTSESAAEPTAGTAADPIPSTKPNFSPQAREWLQMTIRLYDARQNGFGVSSEVWREVRGRGWYRTVRGWTSLTEKGRREIPEILDRLGGDDH